jgi:hypothetical protein
MFFCAWRMFSMTERPLSGRKSAGWLATMRMPLLQRALIASRNPFERSSVTLMPAMPWISTTLPRHLSWSAK